MAGIRDPAFWKRFSVAVHLDEEQHARTPASDLKHSDSWLARQTAKSAQHTRICWGFWMCFIVFIAVVVAVIIWLLSSDVLSGGG